MTAPVPDARDRECTVRRATVAESGRSLAILLEATAWAAARGTPTWTAAEFDAIDFGAAAVAREVILGYEGSEPAATMLLQTVDRAYWPEDAPGSALYLHKVAVRRAYAGRDWLSRLVRFAADDARAQGIPMLRLDTILRPHLQSMYERQGFTVIAEPPLLMRGRQMIRMERRL